MSDKEGEHTSLIIRCRFCGRRPTGPKASAAGRYCSIDCFAADHLRKIILSTVLFLFLGVVLFFYPDLITTIVGLFFLAIGVFFIYLTIVGFDSRNDRDLYRD